MRVGYLATEWYRRQFKTHLDRPLLQRLLPTTKEIDTSSQGPVYVADKVVLGIFHYWHCYRDRSSQ